MQGKCSLNFSLDTDLIPDRSFRRDINNLNLYLKINSKIYYRRRMRYFIHLITSFLITFSISVDYEQIM